MKLRISLLLTSNCSCRLNIETNCRYLLHCPNFTNERSTLLNTFNNERNSLTSCDATIVKLFLHGDESLDLETNTLILNASVDFILSSKRLTVHLYRIVFCYNVKNVAKYLDILLLTF